MRNKTVLSLDIRHTSIKNEKIGIRKSLEEALENVKITVFAKNGKTKRCFGMISF